jgi:hypothetical protein
MFPYVILDNLDRSWEQQVWRFLWGTGQTSNTKAWCAPEPRHVGQFRRRRKAKGPCRLRSPRRTRSGCVQESHRRAFPRSHMQSMSKLSLYLLRLSSGQLLRSSWRESDSESRACANTQRACARRVVAREWGCARCQSSSTAGGTACFILGNLALGAGERER